MRIDQATISLQPRNTSNCIDLAIRFYGRHLMTVLGLWLVVMLPACSLMYELAAYAELDLRTACFVWLIATLPLGTLLMAGAAPHAFGDPFDLTGGEESKENRPLQTTSSLLTFAAIVLTGVLLVLNFDLEFARPLAQQETLRLAVLGALISVTAFRAGVILECFQRLNRNTVRLFLSGLLRRGVIGLGPLVCLFVGGWWILLGLLLCLVACPIAVRTGFAAEKVFLADLDRKLHSRNIKELMKDETAELFFRGTWIVLFCAILAVVLFVTFDVVASLLFRFPIFLGRISETTSPIDQYENPFVWMGDWLSGSFYLLAFDHRVLTVLVAVGLLVYPVGRLAWFFCYLDLRVRRDCWDIELQFAHEADRLETVT